VPAHFEIDAARRLVLSTLSGTVKDDDLRVHMNDLARHPDFDPTYAQLWDLRGAANSDVTGAGLRGLRGQGPWNSATRRAFVCDSDLSFGMARMAEALNDQRPSEIRVFREMSEALDWLEVDCLD